MKRLQFQTLRGCAIVVLTLTATALGAASAQALTRLDASLTSGEARAQAFPGQVDFGPLAADHGFGESLTGGAEPPLVLTGFKRSRSSFSRTRSFKKSRGFSGSRKFKGASRFAGPRRFNGARKFNGARGFGSSIAKDLLRRDRGFQGPRALTSRSAALVRGSRLNSRNLFSARTGAFSRAPFGDSRIRALRAEALALDAQARLIELGLTPAQEAARPAMSPALMRALALTKEAKAKAAAEEAGAAAAPRNPEAPAN